MTAQTRHCQRPARETSSGAGVWQGKGGPRGARIMKRTLHSIARGRDHSLVNLKLVVFPRRLPSLPLLLLPPDTSIVIFHS